MLFLGDELFYNYTTQVPGVITARSAAKLFSNNTLIKRKSNFPHIYGNSEWSSCKVIHEEGLPNI
jgi:hypothetical protein